MSKNPHPIDYQPLVWFATSLTLILASMSASGSSLAIRESSARSAGMALAADGVTAGDAASVLSNPASSSQFTGQQFSLGVNTITLHKDWQGTSSDSAGNQDESVNRSGSIPTLAGAHQIGDFRLTWGYFAPFGGNIKYDQNWYGRYYGTETKFSTRTLDVAGTYLINDKLAVAAGVQYQTTQITLASAMNIGAFGPLLKQPNMTGKADSYASFEGESQGYGYLLGAHLNLTDSLKLGIGFRSSVHHKLDGDTTWQDSNEIASKYRTALATVGKQSQLLDSAASLEVTAPQVTKVAATYQATGDVALFAGVNQTKWSSISDLVIKNETVGTTTTTKFNYKDTVSGSLGTQVKVASNVLVRGGIGYDPQAQSRKFTNVRGVDGDRTIYAVGASYVAANYGVDAAFSYYDINDIEMNQTRDLYPENQPRGDAQGKSSAEVTMFMVGGNVNF